MIPVEKFEHSKLIFVGGKGGVGKTVFATSVAMNLAKKGHKTLLASFNPVHSLTSILQKDVSGGEIKEIPGFSNLYAIEIAIESTIENYKLRMAKTLREFLKYTEIPLDPKPFIDIATMNPAFQEAASFDRMMDMVLDESKIYDKIVFDTAAVANAIRLIGLSKMYGLWLNRIISTRQEALSLKVQLSFRKDKMKEEIKKDPVLNDFLELNQKYEKVKQSLTDPNITNFIFVSIPTMLSISVVKRFMEMVKAYDIPSGGIIMNKLIPSQEAKNDKTGFLSTKYDEQERNMKYVNETFGNEVIGSIRQYSSDVIGIDKLEKILEDFEETSS